MNFIIRTAFHTTTSVIGVVIAWLLIIRLVVLIPLVLICVLILLVISRMIYIVLLVVVHVLIVLSFLFLASFRFNVNDSSLHHSEYWYSATTTSCILIFLAFLLLLLLYLWWNVMVRFATLFLILRTFVFHISLVTSLLCIEIVVLFLFFWRLLISCEKIICWRLLLFLNFWRWLILLLFLHIHVVFLYCFCKWIIIINNGKLLLLREVKLWEAWRLVLLLYCVSRKSIQLIPKIHLFIFLLFLDWSLKLIFALG